MSRANQRMSKLLIGIKITLTSNGPLQTVMAVLKLRNTSLKSRINSAKNGWKRRRCQHRKRNARLMILKKANNTNSVCALSTKLDLVNQVMPPNRLSPNRASLNRLSLVMNWNQLLSRRVSNPCNAALCALSNFTIIFIRWNYQVWHSLRWRTRARGEFQHLRK